MLYRAYGNTGKRVSVVGFGGMRFDTSRPIEENAELVRYACAQGINYFDTAPDYCDGQSELIFGEAFKAMPGEFYCSTKAMPVYVDTAEKTRETVLRSLERMGVPKIHFFHIWCLRKMEHWEIALRPGGMYDGLLQCQAEGLVEHIVCSSHQPGAEIKRILDSGKVEGVLLGLNVLNFPYRWDGVEAAFAGGYGVVAMNPLGGGMIPTHEDKLRFLAAPGESATEAALRFVIACPQVTVTLVGLGQREHVDAACRIADAVQPFTAADLARVRAHLSGGMNAVCTGCGYCKGCPKEIPVASYMQFYNEKQMFGASDEAMRGSLHGFHHHWGLLVGRAADAGACIACGQCEEACTQHLNIVERLREIAAWEANPPQP